MKRWLWLSVLTLLLLAPPALAQNERWKSPFPWGSAQEVTQAARMEAPYQCGDQGPMGHVYVISDEDKYQAGIKYGVWIVGEKFVAARFVEGEYPNHIWAGRIEEDKLIPTFDEPFDVTKGQAPCDWLE